MSDEIDDAYLSRLALPVIEREPAFASLMDARIAQMRLLMPSWDTYMLRSDPINRICRHAAYGDLMFVQDANEVFRATLRDFAEGADLTAKAADWGVIRYDGEDDASLGRRLEAAMKGLSGAGPLSWYEHQAFEAAPERVADVAVTADPTGTGRIYIAILSKDNGGLADESLIETVATRLNLREVRGTNDTLITRPAVIANIDLVAEMWLLPDAAADTLMVADTNLRAAFAKDRRLGWDFDPSWATAKLFVPGVQKVKITDPHEGIATTFDQAVALRSFTPVYKGRAL